MDSTESLPLEDEATERESDIEAAPTTKEDDLERYELKEEVRALDVGDVDSAMGTLVEMLRTHDLKAAEDLFHVAHGDVATDPDFRALALETLAIARVRAFEPAVVSLVLSLINSNVDTIRFAAVAAAGELSFSRRVALRGPMRRVAESDSSASVQSAARAFLSYVVGGP